MTRQEQKEIINVLKMFCKTDLGFVAPDIQVRFDAISNHKQNIIVEAGAGTGKTKLLACRICYLILGKGIKIDEIVAITFTDKAAAEIKQSVMRILGVISKILSYQDKSKPSEAEIKLLEDATKYLETFFGKTAQELTKLIEENFELIERAQISTIHSFAFQILKTYPLQAKLAPGIEVDTGFMGDYIFNKNWDNFLEKELSLQSPHRDLWENLLEEVSLDKLKSFAAMLKEPYFDFCSFENSLQDIKAFINTQIPVIKNLIKANLPEKKSKRTIEKLLEEAINRLSDLIRNFDSLSKEELLTLPVQDKMVFKKSYFVQGWEDETEQIVAQNFIDLANTLTPKSLYLINQAYILFKDLAENVKEQMIRQNLVSYNQSLYFALKLVRENAEVRRELKKRYKSLMVDEFQDTDMVQGQLMLFLSEKEDSFTKDWQQVVLEPGKLFVVGDPKQSIYRFRGANISAYQKFLDFMQSQNAQMLYLITNFRSQGKIIDFVNKWGKSAIKKQNLIQPQYIDLEKGEKPDSEKVEFFLINCQEKPLLDDLRKNEANIVASWIRDNVGKRKLANGELLTYKDITILYSSSPKAKDSTTTKIDIYIDALKRFNIPYNLESNGDFYESQEIIDIINVLKVIYDPQDKLALIGVLRSPLCAMKDEELVDLWQQKALNIFAENFKASAEVKNLYKLLKDFHFKAGHLTLKELLNELFYKTDFAVLETLACSSEQVLANLNKFVRIAFEQASKGFALGQFLLYTEAQKFDIKSNKREGQSSLMEENFDVVNLMTIHKSKGLSAKIIILIDSFASKTYKAKDKYVDDLEGKIGVSLESLRNLNYYILREKEVLHDKAEKERLLYVALTRAEEKLIIGAINQKAIGAVGKSLNNSASYPSPENLENDLFFTTSFEYKDPQSFILQKQDNMVLKENADWGDFIKSWDKNKTEFESYKKEEVLAPSHLKGDKTKIQTSLDIGSLIHKALSNYFLTGSFDLPLAMKTLDLEDSSLLAPCQNILNDFEKGNILKELKAMEFLGSEIPFSMYENGAMVNGVIDALFKNKQEQIFIVDFKTDKIDSKDLKSCSLKYESQLNMYEQAVKKMFKNTEIKKVLAYLSQDLLFEI